MGCFYILTLWWARVSTSLEKNFQSESLTFQFAAVALFLFLYGGSGSVFAVFAWCSMLFCVKFDVCMREVRVLFSHCSWLCEFVNW